MDQIERFIEMLANTGAYVTEVEVENALRASKLSLVPDGDPWALAAEAADVVGFALTRNNGVRLAAFFDLVAGLMRGNPARLKVGFPAAGALSLACRVLDLTAEEQETLREALGRCCERDLNPEPVSAGL